MDIPSLREVKGELEDLERRMTDPATQKNPSQLKELSQRYVSRQKLLALLEQHDRTASERAEVSSLLTSETSDLKTLAAEDLTRLDAALKALEQQLEEMLVQPDARDQRDVIIEIRAGAGGEEAALFASELFRAYTRYGEQRGWKTHTLNTSWSEQGGFKEVIAEVTAPLRQGFAGQISGPFGDLKFERGVHRVQRIPATEKQGRIHTSTVTVAVLPQAEEVDITIRPEDMRIDTYRSSGAGGQHVNKTSSAVRITHLPTNTVVAVQDERSQHKNREKAMRILRSRLLAAQEEARHQQEAAERRQQIGTGDRSEKIRTYNFPQDRITDHRIKQSWGNIESVMEGNLEPIVRTLKQAHRALQLKQ